MNRLSNWSSQIIAGLGSLAVSGFLMAYAIVPASPNLVASISPGDRMSKIAHSNYVDGPVIGADVSSGGSFRLDRRDAKLAGVCGGIANYFDVDAFWVRLGFAAGTIMGFGSLILIYIAIALIAD